MTAVPLHVTTTGHGPEPVVLLHGLLGQGRNLAAAAAGIGDLATSLLVDLPNHGRSGWTGHVDYEEMAGALAGMLRERSAEHPVTLVGHSMGGKTAMCLALLHPDLVARLVVADVSPVDYGHSEFFERIIDAMLGLDLSAVGSRQEADAALAGAIPDGAVRGFVLQNLRRDPGGEPPWSWRSNLPVLRAEADRVAGFPWPGDRRWDGPVLWVAGARSDYVEDRYRPAMRRLFPATRLVRVAGAGHWVHADRPQVFVQLLRSFLGEPGRGLSRG